MKNTLKDKEFEDVETIIPSAAQQIVEILTQYQYSETNVMYFSFNVLRVKGLYIFRLLILRRRYTKGIWYITCV
jgi:hypothetical protein